MSLDDAMTIFSAQIWTDQGLAIRMYNRVLDAYTISACEDALDQLSALNDLRHKASLIVGNAASRDWLIEAIELRLAAVAGASPTANKSAVSPEVA